MQNRIKCTVTVISCHRNFEVHCHRNFRNFNTAEREGATLDEKLATVCRLREGRIAEIETFLSDVPGMDRFFARPR
ncbi:hypothetical protein GALL_234790 [mine drainage metagenome]|uniref:Uncharacterized protein n=1 Tax=mine drainage metagenome TaxID=410659 RepID=A0A1J5RGI8_9ZZZZ